jgi:hypothetical protein
MLSMMCVMKKNAQQNSIKRGKHRKKTAILQFERFPNDVFTAGECNVSASKFIRKVGQQMTAKGDLFASFTASSCNL